MLLGNGCYCVCLFSVMVIMVVVFCDIYWDEILLWEIIEKVVYKIFFSRLNVILYLNYY